MKVYLVRHGETSLNAARILQRLDTPLSERGVKQVERVAQRLASAGVDAAAVQWVNACVTEIEAGPGPKWRITRLACAQHLDGLEALASVSMGPV